MTPAGSVSICVLGWNNVTVVPEGEVSLTPISLIPGAYRSKRTLTNSRVPLTVVVIEDVASLPAGTVMTSSETLSSHTEIVWGPNAVLS